jgi:signal transduction histidine kinase
MTNQPNEAQYYRAFNALLVDCTSLIVQSDKYNFKDRMDLVLGKIGLFSKVDRAYYFSIDQKSQSTSNKNEWCKEGVEPQIENLQDIPFEIFPNWLETISEGKEIYIDDLDKLDEKWAPEREILEPQGIQSLLSIPVRESEFLYGFIGFDAVTFKVNWTEDSIHLLRILADNIGSVIRRNQQNEELEIRTQELEQTQKELELLNSDLEKKVVEKTNEYLKLTQAYNEQEKMAAIGEVAAGVAHDLNTPISNILIGADILQKQILDFFKPGTSTLSPSEMSYATELATRYTPEIFISGSLLEKEKAEIIDYLTAAGHNDTAANQTFADIAVRCRILKKDVLSDLLSKPNALAILRATEKLQTSFSLIETIIQASARSAEVIENLRKYITNKEERLQLEVNLYHSIYSALSIISGTAYAHVHIEIDIAKDIKIKGDAIKLFQLWSNLIKNAMEALGDTSDPTLRIYQKTNTQTVQIYFENNGPAIPKETQRQIFNRFYTTKLNGEATGLGLSIVQKVVHEHGGTVELQSGPNTTVFIIELPVHS